jgi:electron transfer flavoprotein alpha subunit
MSDQPTTDLQSASTIVAIGAGVTTAQEFALVEQLAECLGAAIAGTRPALDRGFIGRGQMIGQTGVRVSPSLYVAVGISGSFQHRTGIDGAATIIAINKDPAAPIFRIAQHGIVGDLGRALPGLIEACRAGRSITEYARDSAPGSSNGQLLHGQ